MIIDKDEVVFILDHNINKKEASDMVKEIPKEIKKVSVRGNLDNILELLLALDQDKYFINVEGDIPFDEMFKSYSGVAFFPAWMELADTYTDHTSTPSSIFDLKKSIMELDMIDYKQYLTKND